MQYNRNLFNDTSHSPALRDLVPAQVASSIIDFCFIANPYYPSPAMIQDLQAQLPELIKQYPSSNPQVLKHSLAEVVGVNPRNILIGNGAAELITIIQRECVKSAIAIPVPGFSEYIEKLRYRNQAALYYLPPEDNYTLNLEDFADWIISQSVQAALIINPGNPTGQIHTLNEIIEFLHKTKSLTHVFIDESFIDFSAHAQLSMLPYIEEFPNLTIIRSMSKHCGVPGLRLGYCVTSNAHVLQAVQESMPVWNINALAEYFITQLHYTHDEYTHSCEQIMQDVQLLYKNISNIPGFYAYPTGANFVLVRIDLPLSAFQLQQILLEKHRMYVRDCSNKIGIDSQHIRIASQGQAKDKLLVEVLSSIATL